MHLTLAEIQTELRRIPGFVRFTVEVARDQITVEVYRQSPWGMIRATAPTVEQAIEDVQVLGRVPLQRPQKEAEP